MKEVCGDLQSRAHLFRHGSNELIEAGIRMRRRHGGYTFAGLHDVHGAGAHLVLVGILADLVELLDASAYDAVGATSTHFVEGDVVSARLRGDKGSQERLDDSGGNLRLGIPPEL